MYSSLNWNSGTNIHPQKTPHWRKQKGQCNSYVCALCPSMSILPLCISHPSIWPSMRTQHEAAHAGWIQHWTSGNSFIHPFVMSSWPCMHMPSKHQPSSMPNLVLSIHLKIHHSTLLVSDLAVELNAKEIGKAMYTPNVRGTELWISYSICKPPKKWIYGSRSMFIDIWFWELRMVGFWCGSSCAMSCYTLVIRATEMIVPKKPMFWG